MNKTGIKSLFSILLVAILLMPYRTPNIPIEARAKGRRLKLKRLPTAKTTAPAARAQEERANFTLKNSKGRSRIDSSNRY